MTGICSKDVRLPVQLQRAMAAEAEAAREARAKVCNIETINFNLIVYMQGDSSRRRAESQFCSKSS